MGTFNLTKVPADQLVAFYGLNFAAAAADGTTDKEELLAIFEMIDLSPLTEKQREKVRGFVINAPSVSSCLDELADAVDELRYAVAVGVIEVLFADDVITEEENAFLGEVCTRLHVTEKQRNAIITFVHEARRIREEGVDNNAAEKAIKSAASGLTAVGVPVAAVYFSGSVVGLSAAGITSGLAALGLGLGMVPGIGIAVLIGTGVFLGTRSLLGDSKEKKGKQLAAELQRKAQLVIKNLQEAINALVERLANLERKAEKLETNQEAIEELRKRLTTLKRILDQKNQRLAVA